MLKIMIYDSGNYHNKKLLKGGGKGGVGICTVQCYEDLDRCIYQCSLPGVFMFPFAT